MDRSEPALVPEWLKSSGSVTGGGSTNHQFSSSSLHSGNFHLLTFTYSMLSSVCFICLNICWLLKNLKKR